MKKIAIISELNLLNINYGNRLQAFALNKYLTDYYKDYETVSLILGNKQKYKITKLSVAKKGQPVLPLIFVSSCPLRSRRQMIRQIPDYYPLFFLVPAEINTNKLLRLIAVLDMQIHNILIMQ